MNFDFKDLMAFGMFIIAMLTFIFNNRKQRFLSPGNGHRKTTLVYFGGSEGGISIINTGQPLVGGCFFYMFTIARLRGKCKTNTYVSIS